MYYMCKNCGAKVEFEYGKETTHCDNCDRDVTRPNDTIASWTFEARTSQLRAMHELMSNANDEEIYMSWIYLMPDGATEEDFKDIALDDAMYNECFDLFVKLIKYEDNRW